MLLKSDLAIKFIKYSIVGLICSFIYFVSVFLFVEGLNYKPLISTAIAFIIMTFFSFYLNKKFTFGSNFTHKKLVRFLIVSIVGFTLNFSIIFLIVNVMSFHYVIGEFVTILIIPAVNFLLNNFWTFQ